MTGPLALPELGVTARGGTWAERCKGTEMHVCRHTCASMQARPGAHAHTDVEEVPFPSGVCQQVLPLRAIGEGGRREAWGMSRRTRWIQALCRS